MRREETEKGKKKTKEGEKNRSTKGNGIMGNLGQRIESSKVRGRSKKAGTREIL